MSDVIHRTERNLRGELLQRISVNTPDFPIGTWIINPDLVAVNAVPKIYWKVVVDDVLEMTQPEKDAVDAAAVVTSEFDRKTVTDLVRSDVESQNATTSFEQKIDETPTLLIGTYRFEWSAIIGGTLTSTESEFRVEINGVQVAMHTLGGLDDAATDVGMASFDDVVVLAGPVNYKMEFRKTTGGGAARISQARIAYRKRLF